MQKKNTIAIIIGIIIVIIVGAGVYFMMTSQDSEKTTGNTPAPTASDTNSSSNASNSDSQAPAVSNAVLSTKTDDTVGQYLATPDGMPLYTYTSDIAGVSNCSGSCLVTWPAYQATDANNLPTDITTLKRSDNSQVQFAYKGMPLYTFASDSNGSVTGDGVGGFAVAKP